MGNSVKNPSTASTNWQFHLHAYAWDEKHARDDTDIFDILTSPTDNKYKYFETGGY